MTTDFLRWYEDSLANDPILLKQKQAEAGQYDQVGTDPAWLGEIQAQALGRQAALKERNRYVGETVAGFNKAASLWQDEIDQADEDIAKAQAKLDELGPSLPGEEDIVNPKVEAYRAKLNEALNRKRTFANALANQRKTWMFGQDARPNLNAESSPLADTRDWLNTPTVKTSGRLEFPTLEPPKTPGPVIVNVTDQKVYDAQAKLAAKVDKQEGPQMPDWLRVGLKAAIPFVGPALTLATEGKLPLLQSINRPFEQQSLSIQAQQEAAQREQAANGGIAGQTRPAQTPFFSQLPSARQIAEGGNDPDYLMAAANARQQGPIAPYLKQSYIDVAASYLKDPVPWGENAALEKYRQNPDIAREILLSAPFPIVGFTDGLVNSAVKSLAGKFVRNVNAVSPEMRRIIAQSARDAMLKAQAEGITKGNEAYGREVSDLIAQRMGINTETDRAALWASVSQDPTISPLIQQSAGEVAQQSAKRQAMREASGPTILERTTKDAGTITPPANSQIMLGQDGKLAGFKMADGSFMPYRAVEQVPAPVLANTSVTTGVTPTTIVKQEPAVMPNVGISQEVPPPKPAISPSVETKASGETIAESLGVKFDGVQKSPEGDYLQYTDPQTGSSFYGNNAEEAKAALDELRGRFKKTETPLTTTPASVKWAGENLTQPSKGIGLFQPGFMGVETKPAQVNMLGEFGGGGVKGELANAESLKAAQSNRALVDRGQMAFGSQSANDKIDELDSLSRQIYKEESYLESLKSRYSSNELLQRKIVRGKTSVPVIDYILENGAIPEAYSPQKVMNIKGTRSLPETSIMKVGVNKGKVPDYIALDEIASEYGMTTDEFLKKAREAAIIKDELSGRKSYINSLREDYDTLEKQIPRKALKRFHSGLVSGEQTTTGQLRNTIQQTGEAGFMGRRPTQPAAAIPTSPAGQRALDRDIEIVADQVEKAKPGQFSTGLYFNIPGMKRVVDAFRPGIGLYHEAKNVLKAAMTGQMSYNNITREAFPKFFDSLKELDTAFGKGAVGDKVLSVNFTGTRPTQGIDVVGKLADIVERPQMYDLTPAQRQAVDNYNAFNEWMRQWTNENYGIDVSKYEMPGGGGYLPHINKNADITDYFDIAPSSQMSAGTKTKQRVWDTIADRAANAPEGGTWNAAKNQWEDTAGNRIKGTFEPETNFQKLAEDSIRFKANLASRRAFDNVAGGLTRLDVLEKQNPTLFRKYQAAIRRVDSLKSSLGRLDDKLASAIDDFKASPMDPDDIQNLVDNIDPTIGRGQRVGMGQRDLEQELIGAKAQLAAVRKNIMATSPRDYVPVVEAGRRYFKAPEAAAIRKIKQRPTGWAKTTLNTMENIRATAFSGDLSPITGVQAPMQFLADPISSMVATEKFMRQAVKDKSLFKQFSAEGVARLLKDDPVFGEYLRSIGVSPNVTPQEFMTGYLGRIPKMNKLTEGTYNVVNQMGYEAWKNNTRRLMKQGMSELEAKSVASYMSQLTSPRVNYTGLGMSPAQAQLFRALPTSYSFIRQPAVLQGNAMKYILKMATGQKLSKVTAIEKESFRTMATLASMMAGVAATSAAISAAAQNKDVGEVMFDAVNPDPRNGKFMSLVVGDHRVPLGGPHRAFFRAMFPQDEVDMFGQKGKLPFSMPFAGMPAYLKNRLSPLLSTQLDLLQNKDYYGKQIMKGDEFFPKILQALEYEAESMMPLTIGSVAESVRTGQDKGKIAENVASQFAGVNVMDITPQSELRQKWQKEIDTYYKLPSDTAVARSQKTRTKEESRRASADLDARLFTIGTVDSVLTPQAMQLAYKYITDNNIDPETIPGIKATMTRHARLRELGQPVEVNTPTERLAYALGKKR